MGGNRQGVCEVGGFFFSIAVPVLVDTENRVLVQWGWTNVACSQSTVQVLSMFDTQSMNSV